MTLLRNTASATGPGTWRFRHSLPQQVTIERREQIEATNLSLGLGRGHGPISPVYITQIPVPPAQMQRGLQTRLYINPRPASMSGLTSPL